jgi:ribosomal-protein-alanine N-acetyltransferase
MLSDATNISRLRCDPSVNKYLDRPTSTSVEEAVAFIQKINISVSNHESLYWAITLDKSNSLIGTICLWNLSEDRTSADVGYELMPDHQQKGIMNEALKCVINYGFETMLLKKIDACTHPDNADSIKLLQKNGFQQHGKLPESNELIFMLPAP